MSVENVNVVVVTGNLTRDPELRALPSGTSLCKLRLAVNGRRKDAATGEWVDKPNYVDVTVWGARGEAAAEHLAKGSPVAVEGRLDWREWEAKDGSGKRQTIEIVGDAVQFLGSSKASKGASDSEEEPESAEEPEAGAEDQPDPAAEAQAQAVADAEAVLRDSDMSRKQLDSRACDLGIENPQRLKNMAAVIAKIAAAEVEFAEFDEAELAEEDRPF
jgi:single-strand DNA-binding protein